MQSMKNILVVLDTGDAARYVLEKAASLAQANHATLHAVRVVYEGVADLVPSVIDQSVDLKTFILESAEAELEELLDPVRRKVDALESATLWNHRHWEGVLHAAEQSGADLIIKGAEPHGRFGEVIRTPDDWNLLRHATVPVMLVKPQAWVPEPRILCALDPFDDSHRKLSIALLQESQGLASVLGGELTVVVAYPLFEPWVGELGALGNYEELKQNIETEIRSRVDDLAREAGVRFRDLVAEEGHATQVISQVAEDTDAELLVIGTHAREGVKGVLLGNTSERILHAVATDVVTVHGN
ncbi:MAG: universal stress protein [Pseudomonadales bacterium]